jgi:4-amino-4-deoxy-L-arabinose transferase-like glycosyltransferase
MTDDASVGCPLWAVRRFRALLLSSQWQVIFSLSALVVVALSLRVFHLGAESLWLDETASVWIASRPLRGVLAGELTNPPLYYLLLHFWIAVFGGGEAAIRWFSVWPSLAAVLLIYVLGKRLYDHRVGLLGAGLAAVSPYQIYYAQEARAFSLLLFLSLCSTLALHVAFVRPAERSSFWPFLWYAVTVIAALHTHFHGVFLLAAHNVVVLIHWREHRVRLRSWVLVQAIVLLAFMPWLITMLQTASTSGGQVRRYLPLKLPEAVVSFLVGDTLVPFDEAAVLNVRETLRSNLHLIVAFTIGFGIYTVSAVRAPAARRYGGVFCAVMLSVVLLAPFAISFKLMIFDRRYVIAASPYLYLLLAAGALYLHDLAVRRSVPALAMQGIAGVIVVGLVGLSLFNYYFNPRFGKEEWREVVAFVEAGYLPGDLVVFDPGYLSVSYEYYSRRRVAGLVLAPDLADVDGPGWRRAREALDQHERVWLLRSHLVSDVVLPRLRGSFREMTHRHFPKAKGIDVYVLER